MTTSKELTEQAKKMREEAKKLEEQARDLAREEAYLASVAYAKELNETKNAHLRIAMVPQATYVAPAFLPSYIPRHIATSPSYIYFLEIFGYKIPIDAGTLVGLKQHMSGLGLNVSLDSIVYNYRKTVEEYVVDPLPCEARQ